MAYDYFYDGQIRRFLMQIVRAFTGFQYQVGGRNGGPPELRQVPCRMATQNRQVGHILKNNSENTLNTVPMITVWIKDMGMARDRTQAPGHVSTVQVTERAYDDQTEAYTAEKGNSYTVERMMPHPLDVTIQVDIWTSNEHQKHQLWEQIFMAFNVGFDIQSSDNPIDWTALSTMVMESLQWSSRSIPVGSSDEIDVCSFTFKLPVWISPPAKVKQQKLIHQIVTNITMGSQEFQDSDTVDGPNRVPTVGEVSGDSVIVTPDDGRIQIENGEITLISGNGSPMAWEPYLSQFGRFRPTESQLRLRAHVDQDQSFDIVGSIQLTGDPTIVQWTIDPDTLPSNTLDPITGIIDPLSQFPGARISTPSGEMLFPAPANGQRYLILNDLGGGKAWANADGNTTVRGYAGDIIEYQNGVWLRVFVASETTTPQFVLNLKSSKQLKFTDGQWIMAIDGEYNPGFWRLRM